MYAFSQREDTYFCAPEKSESLRVAQRERCFSLDTPMNTVIRYSRLILCFFYYKELFRTLLQYSSMPLDSFISTKTFFGKSTPRGSASEHHQSRPHGVQFPESNRGKTFSILLPAFITIWGIYFDGMRSLKRFRIS